MQSQKKTAGKKRVLICNAVITRFSFTKIVAGIIATISVLFSTGEALAGQPIYNWTGLYVGGDIGYRQADAPAFVSSAGLTATAPQSVDGIIGSLVSGFNWEIPSWWGYNAVVIGAEIDIIGGPEKGSHTVTLGAETFNNSFKVPWLTTFRGRFGVPFGGDGGWLAYATAGFGFGRFDSTSTVGGAVAGTLNGSASRGLWVVGGGVEYGFSRYWSWKAEYLYLETGAITNVTPSLATGISLRTGQITESIVRAGVNFHF